MQPLHNRLLVKPIKVEETKSGIILPNSAKNKNIAAVLKIGDAVNHVKIGDRIKHHDHCGIEMDYLGEKCLFIRETDVIAIL